MCQELCWLVLFEIHHHTQGTDIHVIIHCRSMSKICEYHRIKVYCLYKWYIPSPSRQSQKLGKISILGVHQTEVMQINRGPVLSTKAEHHHPTPKWIKLYISLFVLDHMHENNSMVHHPNSSANSWCIKYIPGQTILTIKHDPNRKKKKGMPERKYM